MQTLPIKQHDSCSYVTHTTCQSSLSATHPDSWSVRRPRKLPWSVIPVACSSRLPASVSHTLPSFYAKGTAWEPWQWPEAASMLPSLSSHGQVENLVVWVWKVLYALARCD